MQRAKEEPCEGNTVELGLLLQSWDGKNQVVAEAIWTCCQEQVSRTAKTVLTLVSLARRDPKTISALLRINQCPYLLGNNKPTAPLCTAAIFLMVFEWLETPMFETWIQMEKIPSLPQHTKGWRNFCRLTWVFHSLLVYFPDMFPQVRSWFEIMGPSMNQGTNLNIFDLVPTIPGNLARFTSLLPFQSPLYFLRSFGANWDGNFLTSDATYGIAYTCFPKVSCILSSLSLCEKKLKEKRDLLKIRTVVIHAHEASHIAEEVYGVHPFYWAMQKKCGIRKIQKHFREWVECWNGSMVSHPNKPDLADRAVRCLYEKLKEELLPTSSEESTECPLEESTSLSAIENAILTHQPTEEERRAIIDNWLLEGGLALLQGPNAWP